MTKQTEALKLQTIMEQAQVFASAWSLVGGRFDGGNAMDDAEVAKNELRQMVAEALAEQPAQQEPDLSMREPSAIRDRLIESGWTPPAQHEKTDWEAVAADQAMTIALLKAELQEFAEKQADSVEVALTESGWVWDGDQWQRPPQTWIELDHDDIHALMNEFFYPGMQPFGAHFANFARAIEAKLKEKNT